MVTTTVLALTSGRSAVATVASGSVVTLTATVTADGTALKVGQVNFCDASSTSCTDIHLLGMAQITSAGTATLKFVPSIGDHNYKAVFTGSTIGSASSSSVSPLSVTGTYTTTTTLVSSGSVGNYSLTATVVGSGGQTPPTGTVSFIDTSNGNSLLGTAPLGASTVGLNFSKLTGFTLTPDIVPSISLLFGPGDFNGDGILDLVVRDSEYGFKGVLVGKGDGTFTQSFTVINVEPRSMVVGDFNGDGIADYAEATSLYRDIAVGLGKGDGTFTFVEGLPTFSPPVLIATGDFNKDGVADLVVTTYDYFGDGHVLLALGKGDGTFQRGEEILTGGNNPTCIAVGDFNGDGVPDLAVTDKTVKILLGKGDGTFAAPMSIAAGTNPRFALTADLNGDGKLDLAVANSSENTVTVLLGNGNGTFTAAPSAATGKNPTSIAAADFNGDGKVDLAVSNFDDGSITVLLGSGDGTFKLAGSFATAKILNSIAARDFNGDGLADIIVSDGVTADNPVRVAQLTQTLDATVNGISPIGGGTHQVAASYAGDAHYGASSSGAVPLTGIVPSLAIVPTTSSLTISPPGGSATDIIQFTSVQGFSGTVSLSCQVTYEGTGPIFDMPTCSLNPQQASVTTSSPLTTTLTVGTTAAGSSARINTLWLPSGEALAAYFLVAFLPHRRWKVPSMLSVIVLVLTFAVSGCGGRSITGGRTPSDPGTSKGTYKLVVTATSPIANGSTTILLTLQ